jgi:hypothetical protein
MTKPKKKKKKRSKAEQPPAIGRLGAEQWLAVRQKSGAGPMEPKPRRGTRAQREREAVEHEAVERENEGRDGNAG